MADEYLAAEEPDGFPGQRIVQVKSLMYMPTKYNFIGNAVMSTIRLNLIPVLSRRMRLLPGGASGGRFIIVLNYRPLVIVSTNAPKNA
eukprot:scaffold156765_cov51-Prasinocladus_malaysianus.AAC.3